MNTLLLCLEVFFARLIDVSIGSVRTIYLVKQKNLIACVLAFIEILIWFYIARETLTTKNTPILVVMSYAGGYAVGTYLGGLINKYFVSGTLTAMVITESNKKNLVETLKESGYGVSIINMEKDKMMLIIEFKKRNLNRIKNLIKSQDKNAFIIVNETLQVENGYII